MRCSGRRASYRSRRSTRCSMSRSCSRTSRCRWAPGLRWSVTPMRWGCWPPMLLPQSGSRSRRRSSLGAEATAEDFEAALDVAIDNPNVDAVVAVFIPPLNTTGEEVANVLATVGEQSDKPIVSTFLGSEGIPELLRVPDLEGVAGRGSVPSYPAPESAVRALARVVDYSHWVNRTPGTTPWFEDFDTGAARLLVTKVLRAMPEGGPMTDDTAPRTAALLRDQAREADPGRVVRGGDRSGGGLRLERRTEGDRRPPAAAARSRARMAQHRRRDRHEHRVGKHDEHHRRPGQRRLRGAAHVACGHPDHDRKLRGCVVRARSCRSGWPVRRRNSSATSPTGSRR